MSHLGRAVVALRGNFQKHLVRIRRELSPARSRAIDHRNALLGRFVPQRSLGGACTAGHTLDQLLLGSKIAALSWSCISTVREVHCRRTGLRDIAVGSRPVGGTDTLAVDTLSRQTPTDASSRLARVAFELGSTGTRSVALTHSVPIARNIPWASSHIARNPGKTGAAYALSSGNIALSVAKFVVAREWTRDWGGTIFSRPTSDVRPRVASKVNITDAFSVDAISVTGAHAARVLLERARVT